MIDLYNKSTDELLGSITEADLQVLTDALEEESSDDEDYYIDAATIDVIGDGRATDTSVESVTRSAWRCGGCRYSMGASVIREDDDDVPLGSSKHVAQCSPHARLFPR